MKPDAWLFHFFVFFFFGGGGGGLSLAIGFYRVSIYGIQRAPFVHLVIQIFFKKKKKLSFKDSLHTSDAFKNEKPFN